MLAIVAILLGLACLGLAISSGPLGLFLGFAALRALGQGSLPVIGTLLVAQWFVRYRGRAMAIVALGFAASNAFLPPLTQQFVTTLGWRGAYVALAGMVWTLLLPAFLWPAIARRSWAFSLTAPQNRPRRSKQAAMQTSPPLHHRPYARRASGCSRCRWPPARLW